jgi:alkylation response protein AidB-like acyl-CoA dehydrogenase
MDLDYSPDERAFRDDVRSFLRDTLPPDMADRVRRGDDSRIRDDILQWQALLHARGWGAPAWPQEFGGTGWSKTQQYIFETECALAYAPAQLAFGVKMVAPVLMRYGTPEQQQRHLPRILDGRDWWCQGYSEPGSGSDLASLKTCAPCATATNTSLNGQKIWTTLGPVRRLDLLPRAHRSPARNRSGISFLLIDMKTRASPSARHRARRHRRLERGLVRQRARAGLQPRRRGKQAGWTYAKFLLGHERTNIAGIGASQRELARLKSMAATITRRGKPLLQDETFRVRSRRWNSISSRWRSPTSA